MVTIVDYGMGNLRSIQYKLQKAKIPATISSGPEDIERAEKLILPGVGFFAAAMENLRSSGLLDALNHRVLEEKTPILGICLGMQLFSRHGEEGDVQGLGWIEAETKRFKFGVDLSLLRVPHVGWNEIYRKKSSKFLVDAEEGQRFYFTHSYHVVCERPEDVLATSRYGYDFVCMVERGNILGAQFHPEKSHQRGFEIVKRFARLA